MVSSTLSRVSSRTFGSLLITRDTVIADTPAARATSSIVTLPRLRRLALGAAPIHSLLSPGNSIATDGPAAMVALSFEVMRSGMTSTLHAIATIALAAMLAASIPSAQAATAPAIYKDSRQPIERRVDALLSRMTLDEKV